MRFFEDKVLPRWFMNNGEVMDIKQTELKECSEYFICGSVETYKNQIGERQVKAGNQPFKFGGHIVDDNTQHA